MDIEKSQLLSPPPGYRPSWRNEDREKSTTRRDARKSEFLKTPYEGSTWDDKSDAGDSNRRSRLDLRSSWMSVKRDTSRMSRSKFNPSWIVMGAYAPEAELTALPSMSEHQHRLSHQTHRSRWSVKSISTSTSASRPATGEGAAGDEDLPKGWRLAAIVTALCLAVFCMALDNTIIATAIPRITDTFHALEDVAWYISAYLLTTCSFQLFFGRLYTFFPVKMVFLGAVGMFELGSLICGVSQSSPALIVGRAIAGTGAAGIFSGAILVMSLSVPLRQRPIYIGLAASMFGIASVAGPLLGGVFTDHLSWRWCFYINLPIGGLTVLFIVFFFREPARKVYQKLFWREKLKRLDIPGTLLFVPAVICLILSLQSGGLSYPWSDWRVLLPLIAFFVLLAIFIFVQYKQQDNATVPPRIIMQRSIAGASWFAVMFGGALFILIYYVPIWFQSIWGVSATASGIDSLPLVLACSVFCALSGVGLFFTGYFTPYLIASSVVMSIGCGLVSTFHTSITPAGWIGFQILAGAGKSRSSALVYEEDER